MQTIPPKSLLLALVLVVVHGHCLGKFEFYNKFGHKLPASEDEIATELETSQQDGASPERVYALLSALPVEHKLGKYTAEQYVNLGRFQLAGCFKDRLDRHEKLCKTSGKRVSLEKYCADSLEKYRKVCQDHKRDLLDHFWQVRAFFYRDLLERVVDFSWRLEELAEEDLEEESQEEIAPTEEEKKSPAQNEKNVARACNRLDLSERFKLVKSAKKFLKELNDDSTSLMISPLELVDYIHSQQIQSILQLMRLSQLVVKKCDSLIFG